MNAVTKMLEGIRAVFAPARDPALDEAIKSLNEARDAARNAARLLGESKQAIEAELIAVDLNRLSKRLWSA